MSPLIDWQHPIRHSRLKAGRPYTEWRYLAVCPCCGAERWLKTCDARKAERGGAVCAICSRRENASKGYAATRAKYGDGYAAAIVQKYRLAHPSSLELQVMSHLESLNLSYRREVILCDRWLVDFLIDGQCVIEVDGDYAHSRRDPRKQALRRDQIEQAGYPILSIREADVPHAASLIALFVMEIQYDIRQTPVYAN